MNRRALLAALALVPFPLRAADRPSNARGPFTGDFDLFWRAIDRAYPYFDGTRVRWKRARLRWAPQAERARTPVDLVGAIEHAIEALADDHVTVSIRGLSPVRRVPHDTDVWAAFHGSEARIEAVRASGEADYAGVHPGHLVRRIDGVPVERAIRERLRAAGLPPSARDWALRHALAGPWKGRVRLEVEEAGAVRAIDVERQGLAPANGAAIAARRMGEARDIGYIRVREPFGRGGDVDEFDAALAQVKDTKALLLDLRDLHGAGDRAVTRAVLGRFTATAKPWQVREAPRAGKVIDTVAPRGPWTYAAPVAVLVDRWTAGEGEALAAGLAAASRARLVGTAMAGLRGETREVVLPASGIVVRFPVEKVFLADGTPRERLRPHVEVDPAAPSGGPGDPILYRALRLF